MRFPSLSAAPKRLRVTAIAVVSALLGGLLVVTGALPANADGQLTLTADASSTVLVGNVAKVSLTATNDSASDQYNASFRVVLPAGVSYSAGSTAPSSAGDPQVIQATDGSGQPTTTTLLWSNVGDLLAQDTAPLSFTVLADPTAYPVGSSFSLPAGVYTSADPRTVPKFTAAGAPIPDSTTPVYSATTTTPTTRATALRIEKSEPSPERELMRGVHDHPTVYTITVDNTKEAATEDVTVDDYLPAGLEFLQCGAIDNTSAGTVEYPGAPRLTETTAETDGTDCTGNVPTLVETVEDPEGHPAGVYTHVRWSIGTLAGGGSRTIQYVAAVPLRENSMTFAGGTPATTGAQAANLDNNTGPSTRQDGAAATWTNHVSTSGQYTGPVADGTDRTSTATDTATIEASDLSIVKSTGSAGFVAGTKRTYSLLLRASEYVSDSAMTITDVVDDGLCPVFPADLTPTVTPAGATLPADCDPTATTSMAGDATNGRIVAVAYDGDTGKFTTTIRPAADTIGRSGSSTITYDVLQRLRYSATGEQGPTSAGDAFSNHVDIDGTSTSEPGLGVETGTKTVRDDSGTTIGTETTTIDKAVLPRTDGPITSAAQCAAAAAGDYVDTTPDGPFRLGDDVCFRLQVQFPSSTDTRNARVQDYAPVGTTFADWTRGDESTVPATDVTAVSAAAGASPATWSIGHTVDGASGRYVTKGQTLVLYVMATVTDQGSSTTKPDLVDNLMKYRQTNTVGKAVSLRDSVGYRVAGSPVVALDKSIVSRDGSAITPTAQTSTAEGQQLGYRLTVSNAGTDAAGNAIPLAGVTVWDRLPAGITADDVDPGTGTVSDTAPDGAQDTSRSYIVWTLPDDLEPGTPVTLDYTVTVPQGVSVSTALRNDASVTRFTTTDNTGGSTTWRPADSLDTRAPAADAGTAPAANASATATLADATVTKDARAVADTTLTNVSGGTGVQGQAIAFDYAVTVPARTSVYGGVLADPSLQDLGSSGLPLTGEAVWTLEAPDGPHADGDTFSYGGSEFTFSGGVLTFPSGDAPFDNTTDADVTFTVHVTGLRITANAPLGVITNTARFTSDSGPGGTALPARTDSASVIVAAPAPAISKRSDRSVVTAGGRVVFTLTVTNSSAVDAQDGLVVDCLPAGLTASDDQPALPTGVVRADDAESADGGCAGGTTPVGWRLQDSLALGTTITIPFAVDVDPAAAGRRTYGNTARFVTSSLRDGGRTNTTEGVQRASSNTVNATVQGATVSKQVAVGNGSPAASATGRAGEATTYTVTATLPANVNFYRAALFDTLPSGMVLSDAPTCTASDGVTCTPGTAAGQNTSGDSVVFFTLGDVLAAPTTRTVTLSIPVTVPTGAAAGQVYGNTARLGWSTTTTGAQPTGPGSAYDVTTSSVVVPVTAQRPLVTIAKSVSAAQPAPGDTFTYRVQVTNAAGAGRSDAYDTEVVDCVPAGVRIVSTGGGERGPATSSPSCGSTLTWTIPSIAPGATTTLTYTAQLVDSSQLDTTAQRNTVGVTAYWSLPAASGARYTDVTPKSAVVTPSFPKVSIAKSGATGPAYIGSSSGWTVTFTNTGSPAADLRPTDVLPQGWTYDAGSSTLTRGGTTTAVADPTVTGSGTQTLRWASLGAVPTGTVTLRYTATPTAAVRTAPGIGSTVSHTNTVSADVTDATGATRNAAGSYSPDTATASARIDQADLVLTKSGVDRKPIAGQSGNQDAWTITVRNSGGDTAVGPFTVTDTPQDLPEGAVVTGASGTGWTCATPASDGTFTCTTAAGTTLAVGASLPTITVQVSLASSVPAGRDLTNAASVTARTADGDPTDSTDEGTVSTVALADLRIVKTGDARVQAGTDTTWRLHATNAGPSDAAGPVTITDRLPAGVTVTEIDGDGVWQCTDPDGTDAQVITCTLPDGLDVRQDVPAVTITARVASGATGDLANTATIVSPTTDPSRGDDSSTVTTPIGVGTSLGVTKALRGDFTPGEQATYRVTVENTGTADATGVVVRDPLPTGLTFVRADDVTGTWTRDTTSTDPRFTLAGSITPGKTAAIDIVVAVAPDLRGTVVNTASATADNADETTGRWSSDPTPLTELAITKSHAVDTVTAGTDLDWTIVVANRGPSDVREGVDTTTVQDALPAGVTYVGSTGDADHAVGADGGWTTSGPDADGQVTWTSTAGVTVGSAFPSITVRVHVASGTDATSLANTAVVDGTNATGSVPSETDLVPVDHRADVSITKTLDDGPVVAGTDAHFTLTVTNAGPSDARAVSVTDLVPAGMTLTSVTSTDDAWACGDDGCTRSRMAPGQSTIAVTARVASDVTGTLTNRAEVSWTDDGGHTADATAEVPTRAVAGVTLTKRAVDRDGSATTSVAPGTTQRWELVVHNDGPSDAAGPVVVRDTLPEGLTWAGLAQDTTIAGANEGWTCVPDGQVVDCTSDAPVVAGQDARAPLVIATTVDATLAAGTIENTATVLTGTTSTTDASSSGSVVLAPLANVSITLSHSGAGSIGTPTPFTATVRNDGPSQAVDVHTTITLPAGLTFDGTTGTDPAWTAGEPVRHADGTTTIEFTLAGPLAPGATAPAIVVTAVVGPDAYPSATVGAAVTTATTETTLADNTATDALTVAPLSALSVTKTHAQALERGKTVGYTIVVANAGPTEDPGPVEVTDALPEGLSLVSVDGRGDARCTTGDTVVCTLTGPLAVGASVSIDLTARVATDAPDRIVNTAVVSTPTAQTTTPAGGITADDPAPVRSPAAAAGGAGGGVMAPVLAFTGAQGVGLLVGLAMLALALGLGIAAYRRRRPRV